jgi:hypothetical protein
MAPTYRFIVDFDYWLIGRKRVLSQRSFVFRPIGLLVPISLALFAWLRFRSADVRAGDELGATILGWGLFAISLLLLGRTLLHWRAKKAFAKADARETTCVLSEEGISIEGPLAQSKEAWSLYPRALRFSDGILLMRSERSRLWLPDSALHGASPKEVTDLVQSKTRLRHVA